MEEDRTGTALAIIGIIVIAVIFIAGFFAFDGLVAKRKQNEPVLQNESQYLIIRAFDYEGNLVTPLNYRLYDGGLLVHTGTLQDNIIEKIDDLKNNTNYTMITDHTEYYQSKTICFSNHHQCIANMIRYPSLKVEPVYLKDGYHRILVYVDDGILLDSVICVSDNTMRVTQTKIEHNGTELVRAEIPARSRLEYDRCYYPLSNSTFPMTEGLYEYDLIYKTDFSYPITDNARIEVAVIDSYATTQQRDLDVPDFIAKVTLIENV
jgi:hypothetical protein